MKDGNANKFFRSCLHIYLISITFVYGKCKEKTLNHAGIAYNQTYPTSISLGCEKVLTMARCISSCANIGGCSHVNFYPERFFCELKADDGKLTLSDLVEVGNSTHDAGQIFILMKNSTVVCGNKQCREGFTCFQTASGKKTCAVTDKKCCEDRYLVTGPYGVKANRVVFSSIRHNNVAYMLDSPSGWSPSIMDFMYQFIQVSFLSRKIVKGVVTQGTGLSYSRWVTSFHIKYTTSGDAWIYLKDKSGNAMAFPGNTDNNSKKVNLFSSPISASGVQIRPQTWNDGYSIQMRFDILGC